MTTTATILPALKRTKWVSDIGGDVCDVYSMCAYEQMEMYVRGYDVYGH